MEHCTLPISCLDQLYSTKVLLTMNQDCDSSSLLPCDSRQDSLHHFAKLSSVHEVYSMPKLDTSFHLQSCSTFPCTHVLVESLYNLHKVNIHTFHLLQTEQEAPLPRRHSVSIVLSRCTLSHFSGEIVLTANQLLMPMGPESYRIRPNNAKYDRLRRSRLFNKIRLWIVELFTIHHILAVRF